MLLTSPRSPDPPLLATPQSTRTAAAVPIAFALGSIVLASLALGIDLPLARWCQAGELPGDLRRILAWSEVFAHGLGVALIGLTIYILDPAQRRRLPRVFATAWGAGLAADVCKLIVARQRPYHFSGDAALDSFAGLFPGLWPVEGFTRWDHRLQSFPSAHVAVAAALAVALTSLYPRGRYLFLVFAVLAAGQRIDSGAHFLSDACVGAAVGVLVAAAFRSPNRVTAWFTRFESAGGRGPDFLSSHDP
jgi:membrane-associated phospholipid phosphatase